MFNKILFFKKKVDGFKESKIVEVSGRECDLFNQGRLLLNGLPLKMILHRNRPTFTLMSGDQDEQYKLNILEAVLSLRKVILTPHKFIEIQKNLEVMPARYPKSC